MKPFPFRTCVLCVLAWAVAAVAGPQERRPLLLPAVEGPDVRPAPADADGPRARPAFYYSNGEKVMLFDTRMAIAKPRPEVDPATLKFRQVTLAPQDPLREYAEQKQLLVLDLGGDRPEGLNLAPGEQNNNLEFLFPVVEAVSEGAPTQMIITPTIYAGFAREMNEAQVAEYIQPLGLKVKRARRGNAYELEVAEGSPTLQRIVQSANQLYERGHGTGPNVPGDGRVRFSLPNFKPIPIRESSGDDPEFQHQWHLENAGTHNGLLDADVDAEGAWAISQGAAEIAVAIIDDSVQRNHVDLQQNFRWGRYFDGLTDQETDDPSPRHWKQRHGTACAGVAVGRARNGQGGRGVAPDCSLIGIHFWDATIAQTADAFLLAADGPTDDQPGAAVISCSWRWGAAFDGVRHAIEDVAENGFDGLGCVVLFAAGNEYGTVLSNQRFGSLESVVCVGATNWRDDHSPYSNRGPEVDVVAPSNDVDTSGALAIVTTDNSDTSALTIPGRTFAGYAPGNFTTTNVATGFGGTSSATPLVAGICGLVRSVNPQLTARQVAVILEHTADRIRGEGRPADYDLTTGHDEFYGHGRVNARRAVALARLALDDPQSVWPDHVAELRSGTNNQNQVEVQWTNPPDNFAGVLVVRSDTPLRWRPHDGERYQPGDQVAAGATIVAVAQDPAQAGSTQVLTDSGATPSARYSVFAFNADHKYAWGVTTQVAAGPLGTAELAGVDHP